IWNRNVVPELADAVDAVSVSLNAADSATYDRICRSRFGDKAYEHVLAFIKESVKAGMDTCVSVVGASDIDIAAAREVAKGLGVPLRVR
ncbi:MAG TPA: radical SAM protein, partial [bacterium]|nr:radical SAM protein [bacterium]